MRSLRSADRLSRTRDPVGKNHGTPITVSQFRALSVRTAKGGSGMSEQQIFIAAIPKNSLNEVRSSSLSSKVTSY